jgi:lysyl-tRNA synthetase class II
MKFYQKTWFIWLMLIFLAPVGIILLWVQKKYRPTTRVILSIVFLIFFIIILPKGNSDKQVVSSTEINTSSSESTSQAEKLSTTTQSQKAEEPVTTDTQETTQQKPEYEIEVLAKDLSKAFNDNEIKANNDYKGKLAKITGQIKDIGEMFGQTYIVLSNEDESLSNFVDIQCFFKEKDEINKIAQKNKGDKVTIIGKIDGKSLNVSVQNCKFVE